MPTSPSQAISVATLNKYNALGIVIERVADRRLYHCNNKVLVYTLGKNYILVGKICYRLYRKTKREGGGTGNTVQSVNNIHEAAIASSQFVCI